MFYYLFKEDTEIFNCNSWFICFSFQLCSFWFTYFEASVYLVFYFLAFLSGWLNLFFCSTVFPSSVWKLSIGAIFFFSVYCKLLIFTLLSQIWIRISTLLPNTAVKFQSFCLQLPFLDLYAVLVLYFSFILVFNYLYIIIIILSSLFCFLNIVTYLSVCLLFISFCI